MFRTIKNSARINELFLSNFQNLALKQPAVCVMLGLPSPDASGKVQNSGDSKTKELPSSRKVAIEYLSPKELFAVSLM